MGLRRAVGAFLGLEALREGLEGPRGAREEPAGSVEASRLEPARAFLQALGCGLEEHSGGATAELDSQPRPARPCWGPTEAQGRGSG